MKKLIIQLGIWALLYIAILLFNGYAFKMMNNGNILLLTSGVLLFVALGLSVLIQSVRVFKTFILYLEDQEAKKQENNNNKNQEL